jgi:DNA-binding MarR family transcriptional regulator
VVAPAETAPRSALAGTVHVDRYAARPLTSSSTVVPIDQAPRVIRVALERYARAATRHRTALASLLGLVETDVLALEHLKRDGELTPGELADRMQLSSGGMTAVIDRLHRHGHVARHPHPSDRRRSLLRAKAKKRVVVASVAADDIASMVNALTPDERACVERFIMDIADLAERQADRLADEARSRATARLDLPEPIAWA